MPRCSLCRLAINSSEAPPTTATQSEQLAAYIYAHGPTCRECHDSLNRYATGSTADLKARQARRRELKPLLADLLRQRAANRAEIAKKILTFVGFDLPGQ